LNPIYKNGVAIFYPNGFLDGNNATSILAPHDESEIISKKPEAVFVSLRKILFFNKKGMNYLAQRLNALKDECGAFVGFCDYDTKKYELILSMFQDGINFSLIESEDIVFLFAGTNNFESKSVIIYSDDNSQKNQLAISLIERKLEVKIAQNRQEFEKERKKFDFIVYNSYIGNIEKRVSISIRNSVVIYTLRDFLDSTIVDIFDMRYHKNSIKVGFRIFCFDATGVSSVNIHGANFLSKIAIDGAEFGVNIVICGLHSEKITEVLSQDLEDAGILIYDDLESFFEEKEMIKDVKIEADMSKKSIHIDKKIISILPNIIEVAVHTIEVLSGKKAVKTDVKIQELNIKNDKFIVSIVGIYDDVDAVFMLAMHRDDAKAVCKILLPEKFTDEELFYAFSEFSNVIGGKIKQVLKSLHIEIETTMPRIFDEVSEVQKLKSASKGIQANFKIKDRDMILFLSN